MEDKINYPKFQWSVFVKNGRDQQYVVRADTAEELFAGQKDILAKIGEEAVTHKPTVPYTSVPELDEAPMKPFATTCKTCKAVATQKSGISKTGKPYNAIFCSSEDRSHTVWL